MISIKKEDFTLQKILPFLMILFFLIFPKGGFKINNIPITWGYLILGVTSLSLLIKKKYILNKDHILMLICLLPFQITILISLMSSYFTSLGFLISLISAFFILPFVFLFSLSSNIEKLDLNYLLKFLKIGIFIISIYGIVLFFFRILFGFFFEVPFITTNFHDSGILDYTKCIQRGSIFKLISTYNNGIVFGLCVLMLLPIFEIIETSLIKKWIVKAALILTLSRTIWIGLILHEFFTYFFLKKNKKTALTRFMINTILISSAIFFITKIDAMSNFVMFDKTLSNRINQINNFEISFFSNIPFSSIQEIVYISVLNQFGILGMLFFLAAILSPIYIYIIKNNFKFLSQIDLAILLGFLNYLILCFSDGAMLFIPVMGFFWFLASFLLKQKNFLS